MRSRNVIAEGETLLTKKRQLRGLRVQLARPVQQADGGWFCAHRIIGLDEDDALGAYGESSLQALLLSIQMIEIKLLAHDSSLGLEGLGAATPSIRKVSARQPKRSAPSKRSKKAR